MKRVAARYRLDAAAVLALARRGSSSCSTAARRASSRGGVLVYSTCSILPAGERRGRRAVPRGQAGRVRARGLPALLPARPAATEAIWPADSRACEARLERRPASAGRSERPVEPRSAAAVLHVSARPRDASAAPARSASVGLSQLAASLAGSGTAWRALSSRARPSASQACSAGRGHSTASQPTPGPPAQPTACHARSRVPPRRISSRGVVLDRDDRDLREVELVAAREVLDEPDELLPQVARRRPA